MGAGQAGLAAGAVGVQRVFDDVVPGDADRVDEQLAAERRQAEAGAHLGLSMAMPPTPAGRGSSHSASTAPSPPNSRSQSRTDSAP